MSSSLPLILNPPIHHNKPRTPFSSSTFSSSHSLAFKSVICFSSDPSQFDRQEALWLREEQRWLREEQRWLREEQRWARDRDSLLLRISELELRIEALEHQKSVQAGAEVSETIASIAGLLQVLKEKSRIADTGSGPNPFVLEEDKSVKETEEEEKELVVERVIRVVDGERRTTLRKGSEGAEVRAMQEALQKLGFYSGEEDIEFSSFSSGTERAVKTWQASLGATEDGIMTEELLERLYVEQIQGVDSNINAAESKEGGNGAAISSVTEISNIQQTVVDKKGVSQHRVFLLGENRWEEPSRLVSKKAVESKTDTKEATTKCHACRGEGRLLCTECDGTGEPNIEPQFLEWVDEGAKCPYCEGLGYTICDTCEGKTVL